MKTVKIQGGLGNQLFGLAFAHSLQTLGGDLVALDLAAYGADRYGKGFLFRDLAANLGRFPLVHRPWLASRAVTAAARRLPAPGIFVEGTPPEDPAALKRLADRNGYFSGYWQDEAYIAAADAFRAAVRADLQARVEPFAPHDVVIHYRTYKEEIRPARRAVPGPAYFRHGLASFADPVGTVRLISDDVPLALAQIGDIGAAIDPIVGGSAWSDMAALTTARRLILTNSSFSWWGGYCSAADAIVYPERGDLFHYPSPAARFSVIRT